MTQEELNNLFHAAELLDPETDTAGHFSWVVLRLMAKIALEEGEVRWFKRIGYKEQGPEILCFTHGNLVGFAVDYHGSFSFREEMLLFLDEYVPPELRESHRLACYYFKYGTCITKKDG